MYEIRPSPGKGLGVFSTRSIKRGECIMTDKAILSHTKDEQQRCWFVALRANFDRLSREDKDEYQALFYDFGLVDERLYPVVRHFMSLYLNTEDDLLLHLELMGFLKIMAIFLTNNAAMGFDAENGQGIFPKYSRLNHSCLPNATWTYNPETERMDVYAHQDIAVDEEITISYVDPITPSSVRMEKCQKGFGFACDCVACEGSEHEIRETRRQRIFDLYSLIESDIEGNLDFDELLQSADENLDRASEYIALLQDEGIVGVELAEGYEFCAFFHAIKGDYDEASSFGEKALENRRACRGYRLADEEGLEEDLEENSEDHEDSHGWWEWLCCFRG
ncbi:hypothetical protein M434DRAFT_33017 [Hypoxylon sp. CO27-5]|nr:hypothetical protein M434DRAFT_33017 [Hypoxylon sp. CO27-5]